MVSPGNLFALVAATSFSAGLNAYATVATLGILARTGILELPPSLEMLATWPVIGAASTMYLVEFVADKIPAFDLAWNALHTFVRVPVAALLAYSATMELSLRDQLIATVVGSSIALAAHGGKTAARVAVTPSPEPFSNIALSLGEDVVAVFLTWLAAQHPYWAAAIAITLVAVIVVFIRLVIGAICAGFRRMMRRPPDPVSSAL